MGNDLQQRTTFMMPRKADDSCNCVMACTLCRSGRQSISTLEKASRRKVRWPEVVQKPPNFKEPSVYTSIDDAFDNVLQFMNTTTRQCKRYYRCREDEPMQKEDKNHCQRFHAPERSHLQYRNPLQKPEDVKVEMAPGTYAITAGRWGGERDHTHVVHVTPGQTIDLTFGV